MYLFKPGQYCSVIRALAQGLKGLRFDSGSPVGVHAGGTSPCFSLSTATSPSPHTSPTLPSTISRNQWEEDPPVGIFFFQVYVQRYIFIAVIFGP